MEPGRYSRILGHLPVFKGLNEAQLADLAQIFQTVRVGAGVEVCREGQAGDSAFVVVTGEVSVVKTTAQGDTQQLAELAAPTVVGEMALIDRGPRSASVRTKTGCELYRIDAADFDRLRAAYNPAAYKIIRNLALVLCGRLRDTNDKINAFFANPEASLAELGQRQGAAFGDRVVARPRGT